MRYFTEWAIVLVVIGHFMSGVAYWDDLKEGRPKSFLFYLSFPWGMLVMLPVIPILDTLKDWRIPGNNDGPLSLFKPPISSPRRDPHLSPGYGRKRRRKKKSTADGKEPA